MLIARRHIAPLVFCALALQLVLGLPAYPGLVLCVGSDGHVAVESGACVDETPGVATRCDELGESAPCTDTPLAARELLSGSSPRASDHAEAAATAPFLVVAPGGVPAANAPALAAALVDPSRRHRSGILRL